MVTNSYLVTIEYANTVVFIFFRFVKCHYMMDTKKAAL
ncbi:MAG: hypothetical protein IEMM0006_0076 [bacterium]|nr:MAG: hypothetical protein IEMM0006_0076 [bacterium]